MEILFVVGKPNVPCLYTITIRMYSAQNEFPFCKLQGVINKQIFLIHCAPSPPTLHLASLQVLLISPLFKTIKAGLLRRRAESRVLSKKIETRASIQSNTVVAFSGLWSLSEELKCL